MVMNNEFDISIAMEVVDNVEIAYTWTIHMNKTRELIKSYPLFFVTTELAYSNAMETAIRMTKNNNKRMTKKEDL